MILIPVSLRSKERNEAEWESGVANVWELQDDCSRNTQLLCLDMVLDRDFYLLARLSAQMLLSLGRLDSVLD